MSKRNPVNPAKKETTPQTPAIGDEEKNSGADQTPDLKPETNDQASKENDGTGLESKKMSEAKRVTAKRPLLHNGKAYTLEDDVTGVFEDEELERLLKIGAIVEA